MFEKKNSISTSHFPPEPFKITSLCPLCLHIFGVFSFQGRYYPSGPWCCHQNEEVGAEASLLVLMLSIQNLLHLLLLSLCFSSVRHSSVFDCISLWYTHLGTFSQTGLQNVFHLLCLAYSQSIFNLHILGRTLSRMINPFRWLRAIICLIIDDIHIGHLMEMIPVLLLLLKITHGPFAVNAYFMVL